MNSISRLPVAFAGEVEQKKFQHADAAHQVPDRGEAAGLIAQLAMHGR
jgi:hypothetical protein